MAKTAYSVSTEGILEGTFLVSQSNHQFQYKMLARQCPFLGPSGNVSANFHYCYPTSRFLGLTTSRPSSLIASLKQGWSMKKNSFLDLSFPRIWERISLLLWPVAIAYRHIGKRWKSQGPSPSKTFPNVFIQGPPQRANSPFCSILHHKPKKQRQSHPWAVSHPCYNYIPRKGGEKESWSLWTVETCTQNMATWQLFGSPHIFCLT